MGEAKKTFFRDRMVGEMKRLKTKQVYTNKELVKRILDLELSEDGIELRTWILPGEFYRKATSMSQASNKFRKHGPFLKLIQPNSQQEAYFSEEDFLDIRRKSFREIEEKKEGSIYYAGYAFKPVQGLDRRWRHVPFDTLGGAKLFCYAEQRGGIKVSPYDKSERVKIEGANIVCTVPSETEKESSYTVRFYQVPVKEGHEKRAIALGIASTFTDKEPKHHTFKDFKYGFDSDQESSNIFTFDKHVVAAYYGLVRHYQREGNLVPMEMNPFALLSKAEMEFYKKLDNNVLIYDPTLIGKDKLRHLHLAEKDILIARSISVLGHDKTLFCSLKRDGKFQDYDWSIPGREL